MVDLEGGDAGEVGAALAALHLAGDSAWPSMHEYQERPHTDGWSLRSALVRYGQPEPVRAGAVLELVRRTESGYADHRLLIERTPRVSDLARARHRFDEAFATVLDAYLATAEPLTGDEQDVIPVLSVAVGLDELGAVLARWAVEVARPRPDDAVDAACLRTRRRLDALGVERQDWYR